MCDLKSEPWREKFTGPPCMCGVPTAGNDEEREIERQMEANKRLKMKELRDRIMSLKKLGIEVIFDKNGIQNR